MIDKDRKIISYIQEYCISIENHIQRFGDDYTIFCHDEGYFHSVTMCILQIGELSNKLSDNFKLNSKNQIPWGEIIGLRNKMAHTYGKINKQDIWDIIKNDIPYLHQFCNKVLEKIQLSTTKKSFNYNNITQDSDKGYDIDY